MSAATYCGRFAPSPTGPLHAGSVVAALASWLDARAHQGRWLVRIEDVDGPRCPAGMGEFILQQLAQLGLHPDAPPIWQSTRSAYYAQALAHLQEQSLAYPCACTRKDLARAWLEQNLLPNGQQERPYPGTCRLGLQGKPERSWRFHLEKFIKNCGFSQSDPANQAHFFIDSSHIVHWRDRRQGWQQQDPTQVAGDFILRRADGLWAYQLAVVVDDADQGITHIVRGEDLSDNTPRQWLLQRALGLPHPHYLHTPLLRLPDGSKLSKQHGAPAAATDTPWHTLALAADFLGLPHPEDDTCLSDALNHWVKAWRATYNAPGD